jgi:hypothetical protein
MSKVQRIKMEMEGKGNEEKRRSRGGNGREGERKEGEIKSARVIGAAQGDRGQPFTRSGGCGSHGLEYGISPRKDLGTAGLGTGDYCCLPGALLESTGARISADLCRAVLRSH